MYPSPSRRVTVLYDKLVLATGLTSEPNMPVIAGLDWTAGSTSHNIHAKDVGKYCRDHLGYHPVPDKFSEKKGKIVEVETRQKQQPLRSVAIYGANKSSFDFVHLFASLHRGLPGQHMNVVSAGPVQVHWVIRDKGLDDTTGFLSSQQTASHQ